MKKNKKIQFSWKHFKIFILIALSFLVFVTLSYFINFKGGLSNDQSVWGSFGDYIGGLLNPLLSFLAFIALLYTILLQGKELRLTRKEFKKSTNELRKQNNSMRRQNFENRFFTLIQSHKLTASNLRVPGPMNQHKVDIHGKPCFEVYYWSFKSGFNGMKPNDPLKKLDPLEQMLVFVQAVINRFDFSYYLFEHVDIIDTLLSERTVLSVDQFAFYSNVIRRQYNKHELFFLYFFHYLCLHSKYKDFLNETEFFENSDIKLLPNLSPYILEIYGVEAFGEMSDEEWFLELFEGEELDLE